MTPGSQSLYVTCVDLLPDMMRPELQTAELKSIWNRLIDCSVFTTFLFGSLRRKQNGSAGPANIENFQKRTLKEERAQNRNFRGPWNGFMRPLVSLCRYPLFFVCKATCITLIVFGRTLRRKTNQFCLHNCLIQHNPCWGVSDISYVFHVISKWDPVLAPKHIIFGKYENSQINQTLSYIYIYIYLYIYI